jgi:hypothetical protein
MRESDSILPCLVQHGEDGIDGRPVPQDLWGLRGALKGAAGLPTVPERIEPLAVRGISNDPFPGLNRAGNVERSIFRQQVAEWCPPHRFQERFGDTRLDFFGQIIIELQHDRSVVTREDIERTEISDVPSYLEKYENAALIAEIKRGIRRRRMRESGKTSDQAENDKSVLQMAEEDHHILEAIEGRENGGLRQQLILPLVSPLNIG